MQVRKDTSFSMDDFTYGRVLFTQGKVDVACLWEPDVTLALNGRPGLAPSVLDRRRDRAGRRRAAGAPGAARPDSRTWPRRWPASGSRASSRPRPTRPAAAQLDLVSVVPRFTNELGYDKTLQAFDWVKWTDLGGQRQLLRRSTASRRRSTASTTRRTPSGPSTRRPRSRSASSRASLRNDSIVRKLWEAEGKQAPVQRGQIRAARSPRPARPVFTKPVTINFDSGDERPRRRVDDHPQRPAGARSWRWRAACTCASKATPTTSATRQLNQSLSEKRAQAIVDYLVSRGVEREPHRRQGQRRRQADRQQQDRGRPRLEPAHRHPVHQRRAAPAAEPARRMKARLHRHPAPPGGWPRRRCPSLGLARLCIALVGAVISGLELVRRGVPAHALGDRQGDGQDGRPTARSLREGWASLRRVLLAVGLSAVVGIPIGVAMGAFGRVESFLKWLVFPFRTRAHHRVHPGVHAVLRDRGGDEGLVPVLRDRRLHHPDDLRRRPRRARAVRRRGGRLRLLAVRHADALRRARRPGRASSTPSRSAPASPGPTWWPPRSSTSPPGWARWCSTRSGSRTRPRSTPASCSS